MISKEIITQIKEKHNIVVYTSKVINIKKSGKRYTGLCPFCKKETFTLFPETKSFYCFSCKTGGDIITLYMKINNVTYPYAVKQLADECGIDTNPVMMHLFNTK